MSRPSTFGSPLAASSACTSTCVSAFPLAASESRAGRSWALGRSGSAHGEGQPVSNSRQFAAGDPRSAHQPARRRSGARQRLDRGPQDALDAAHVVRRGRHHRARRARRPRRPPHPRGRRSSTGRAEGRLASGTANAGVSSLPITSSASTMSIPRERPRTPRAASAGAPPMRPSPPPRPRAPSVSRGGASLLPSRRRDGEGTGHVATPRLAHQHVVR